VLIVPPPYIACCLSIEKEKKLEEIPSPKVKEKKSSQKDNNRVQLVNSR
jgi:hypothetical protein